MISLIITMRLLVVGMRPLVFVEQVDKVCDRFPGGLYMVVACAVVECAAVVRKVFFSSCGFAKEGCIMTVVAFCYEVFDAQIQPVGSRFYERRARRGERGGERLSYNLSVDGGWLPLLGKWRRDLVFLYLFYIFPS